MKDQGEVGTRYRLVAVAFLLGLCGETCGFLYDARALGPGFPKAMNELSQVVGSGDCSATSSAAMLWDASSGTCRALSPRNRGNAVDINDLGHVIVYGLAGNSVLWKEGEWQDLGSPGGEAVNNLVQVVIGQSIWQDGGTVQWLDGVMGQDINDQGQVAGWLYEHGAVIWEDGEVTEIGPDTVEDSAALSINEVGQAAGVAEVHAGHLRDRAFYWDGLESVILATLGGIEAQAGAVNDLAQIVGWSDTPDGDRHACLWEDGAIADLNELLTDPFPFTLVEAVDINNLGQIACRAVDASGGGWAVLLNPIPEPGTLLLIASGVALALGRRRRGLP